MRKHVEVFENIKALKGYYRHLLLRQQIKSITLEECEILNFFINRLKAYPMLNKIIRYGVSVKEIMSINRKIGGNTYIKYLSPLYFETEQICMEIFKKEKEIYDE
jgi:hypothetical protein